MVQTTPRPPPNDSTGLGDLRLNLIDEGINILEERKLRFVSRFIPYFLASYGAHNFNLVNRSTKVYKAFGRIPDCRLQILFTAPPGFSKSFFLKQLLHESYGLLNTGNIPTRFAGSVTEAGWTGSSTSNGGLISVVPGLAETYKNGIIGMEEFAALNALMQTQHSAHLEQALAMSLFEGDVAKDLKGCPIVYHTDVTLWAGNQIMNFKLSGGLFRRFFHVFWTPRLDDAEELKVATWEGDNVAGNQPRLLNYKAELMHMVSSLPHIRSVKFTDGLRVVLGDSPHFEMGLYKNLAIGYTLMRDTHVPTDLVVDVDEPLRKLLISAMIWRRQLLADPRGFQVEALLYDMGADDAEVPWSDVREKNLMFSVSYEETDGILRSLMMAGRVIYGRTRKTIKLA